VLLHGNSESVDCESSTIARAPWFSSADRNYVIVSKTGSDAILAQLVSLSADQPGQKQIDFAAAARRQGFFLLIHHGVTHISRKMPAPPNRNAAKKSTAELDRILYKYVKELEKQGKDSVAIGMTTTIDRDAKAASAHR
jgi:hypothetical protein